MKNCIIKSLKIFLIFFTNIVCATTPSNETSNQIINSSPSLSIYEFVRVFLRKDLPSLTFNQLVNILPAGCLATGINIDLTCPERPEIEYMSYAGGPDGDFYIEFNRVVSCQKLIIEVAKKFGSGKSLKGGNIVCGRRWTWRSPKARRAPPLFYIDVIERDWMNGHVMLQLGAESGP